MTDIDLSYIAEGLRGLAVSVETLHEDSANARTGHAVDRIAASLKQYGQRKPVVVNRAQGNKIEAGNGTFRAARALGWTHIAVVFVDDDPATAAAFGIADNRVGEFSEWDPDVLDDLIAVTGDLFTGFTPDEFEELTGKGEKNTTLDDPGPRIDKALELQEKWKTEPGQLWLLDSGNGTSHRLLCGDATNPVDVDRVLQGEPVNLLWTDPPYGVEVEKDGKTIDNDRQKDIFAIVRGSLTQAARVLGKKSAFYIAGPHGPQSHEFGAAIQSAGLKWTQTLLWIKNNLVLGRSDYQNKHEVLFYGHGKQGRVWVGGRKQTTILQDDQPRVVFNSPEEVQIDFGGEVILVRGAGLQAERIWPDVFRFDKPNKSPLHPTTKPVELVERCILNSSEPGAIVFDGFCGSGTTIIACERLGRSCRALEIDPKYVAVALERWSLMTGQVPALASE